MIITYVTVTYNNNFNSFYKKHDDIMVLLVFFLTKPIIKFYLYRQKDKKDTLQKLTP